MKASSSPCTGVCRIDQRTGWCLGCKRTMDEIEDWPGMSERSKRAVLKTVAKRDFNGAA